MKTWLSRLRLLSQKKPPRTLTPDEGYCRWAAAYGREPNAFQQLESPALEKLLPETHGRLVLDLGCGRGRVARVVSRGGATTVAADLSLAMLADAKAFPGARLAARVGAPLPFRSGSFDLVVCALVLGHVKSLSTALSGIADVLHPDGHLLLSDFHPYATLRGWDRTFEDPESGEKYAIEQHLHLFSDYVRELGRCGLTVDALEEVSWQGSPVVFVLRARRTRD